jgi:hypothetical protein
MALKLNSYRDQRHDIDPYWSNKMRIGMHINLQGKLHLRVSIPKEIRFQNSFLNRIIWKRRRKHTTTWLTLLNWTLMVIPWTMYEEVNWDNNWECISSFILNKGDNKNTQTKKKKKKKNESLQIEFKPIRIQP